MKYIDKTSKESKVKAKKLDDWVKDWSKRFPNRKPTFKDFRNTILNNYSKKDLYQDLWEEQGTICCYCGQYIPEPKKDEGKGRATVEHFIQQEDTKIAGTDEDLKFENLILSCMGKEYDVLYENETVDEFTVRKNISKKIVEQTKPLIGKEGEIIFTSGTVYHCNLKRNNVKAVIINPTDTKYNSQSTDCWRLFDFFDDCTGSKCQIEAKDKQDLLTKDTIRVLGLDCDFLCKKRGRQYREFEKVFLFDEGDYDDGSKHTTKERNLAEKRQFYEDKLNQNNYPFCSLHFVIMQQHLEKRGLLI